MKNLPLLAIFAGVLIYFITSPLFSFAEESKILSNQYLSNDQIKKSIAEYCQELPYKNASYSVISDEEYAIYAALVESLERSKDLKRLTLPKRYSQYVKEIQTNILLKEKFQRM